MVHRAIFVHDVEPMRGPGQLVRRYLAGWASSTGRKTPLLEGKSKHDGSR
jgi:hypothetical protein